MSTRITLHSHSPTFDEALKQLRRHPASQLRFLSVASDTRYAAMAWKRLFLTALKRLARHRPEAARLLAIQALNMFSKTAFSTIERQRAKFADLREVADELRDSANPLPGAATPRLTGLHPEILCHRYEEAWRCFQRVANEKRSVDKVDITALWDRWGGGVLPKNTRAVGESTSLIHALQAETNAKEQGILLLATAQRSTKAVIRNALSRAGALRARAGYCPNCKFRRKSEQLESCSICWTRASQVNVAQK